MPEHDSSHRHEPKGRPRASRRPPLGVYLYETAPLLLAVKRLLIEDYELLNPEVALPDPDRVTVYLSNHGPMFAPLPAPVLTVDYLLQQGGYDELIAITLFHRAVQFMPGFSHLLARYFGHSTPELHSLSGLIALMKERAFNIIGTSPEGASCVGIYEDPVGPFTKPGLMIAGLEAGADIILAAQRGVECFGLPVRLPAGLSLPLAGRPRGLQLPFWYPGCKARVTLKYERYQPLRTAEDRARLSPGQRRAQLREEIDHIHHRLSQLYQSIPML